MPLPMQATGWEGVTVPNLSLIVEQSYPEIEGVRPVPVSEAARRVLAMIGIQVTAEAPQSEATLTFTATGKAKGAYYYASGGGEPGYYYYTGAEIKGHLVLAIAGRAPLILPVSGDITPAGMILGQSSRKYPSLAPFDSAWARAILDGLGQLWGPEVLVAALADNDYDVQSAAAAALAKMGLQAVPALIQVVRYDLLEDVRIAAANVLGDIGPEAKGAVPALIQAIGDDEDSGVRFAAAYALGRMGSEAKEAVPALIQALDREKVQSVRAADARALKTITGQDFGEDAARWQQWLQAENSVGGAPSAAPMSSSVLKKPFQVANPACIS